MTDAEKLANAVLLFACSEPWGQRQRDMWRELTGEHQVTAQPLADLAWRVLYPGAEPAEKPAQAAKRRRR